MSGTNILYHVQDDVNDVKTALKNPTALQWSISDVEGKDGSGINQCGQAFRDIIARKQQLACSWGAMTTEELKTLLDVLNQTFFSLEYMDPSEGQFVTGEFYVASKSAPAYSYDKATGTWLWSGLSATLVER